MGVIEKAVQAISRVSYTIISMPAQTPDLGLPSRGQLLMRSVNDARGFLANNIVFQDEGPLSRGGPVWRDVTGRLQAWIGWHDRLPNGQVHHGFEVKTAASPSGDNPDVLVTRLKLASDADQTTASLFSTSMFYMESGIARPRVPFGIKLIAPAEGSVASSTAKDNRTLGELLVEDDGAGTATVHLTAGVSANTVDGEVRLNSQGSNKPRRVRIMKGDPTWQSAFLFDGATNAFTLWNGTEPEAVFGQGSLFVRNGALYFKGGRGTVTKIADA